MKHSKSIETLAVHAGRTDVDELRFRPVAQPIHLSVAYMAESMEDADAVFAGEQEGYVYARYGNPTVRALERAVAQLEGAEDGIAYSSGMAAIHAALLGAGARPGVRLLSACDVYGATYALQDHLLAGLGIETTFVDVADREQVAGALQDIRPVALICETISNPLLKVADLGWLTQLAHSVGAAVIVDNTFATPYLVRPLTLGVDYVVHSATKYLAGHGDVLAGLVLASSERVADLRERQKLLGANLGPHEAWLALRGLRTLALRMRQHCSNALAVAEWLDQCPDVAQVNYPGIAAHPQHGLALDLFGGNGFGGMISFDIKGAGRREAFSFMDALELVLPATTLGDVFSLVLYPAHSSHRALPPNVRQALGIGDGLVRMSVGIEDAEDIIADLAQALARR